MRTKLKRVSLFLMFALAASYPASASAKLVGTAGAHGARNVGVGAIGGQPTGITGKYWFQPKHAVDAGIGYIFDGYVAIYSDWLLHIGASETLKGYLGGGLVGLIPVSGGRADSNIVNFFSEREISGGVGVRIPFGIEWEPAGTTLGLFLEVAPGAGLLPRAFAMLQGGAGLRVYIPAK